MGGISTRNMIHYFVSLAWAVGLCFLEEALAYSLEKSNGEEGITSSLTSGHVIIAGAVCVVVFVLVVVLVVPGCMDCMNSEVSSENHPACSDTTHKWGGATGYTPADANNPGAGFRTGEMYNPDDHRSQHLPYSMVPTQIPEQGGFLGYQSGGGDNPGTGGGLAGFNMDGRRDSGAAPTGQGPTHYNPMEPQEPPPPYTQAAQF